MKKKYFMFDLYGTLLDIRTDEQSLKPFLTLADQFRAEGADTSGPEVRILYHEILSALSPATGDAWESYPEMDIVPVFEALRQAVGLSPARDLAMESALLFRQASTSLLALYPDVKEVLEALRESGARIILLSNAQALYTRYELEKTGLDTLLDEVYLSSDYGIRKPDRRYFLKALNGRNPEEFVMTGNDMKNDILPAEKLGMETVYIAAPISPADDSPKGQTVYASDAWQKAGEHLLRLQKA